MITKNDEVQIGLNLKWKFIVKKSLKMTPMKKLKVYCMHQE